MSLLRFQVQIGNLHRPLHELEVYEPGSHQLIAVVSPELLSTILEHYFMQASLTQKLQQTLWDQAQERALRAKFKRR